MSSKYVAFKFSGQAPNPSIDRQTNVRRFVLGADLAYLELQFLEQA